VRSQRLAGALADFVDDAAVLLARAVADGAEVPFEITTQQSRRQGPSLYAYRPLTARFISAHSYDLCNLSSYEPAIQLLADGEGLERYLLERGVARMPIEGRPRAKAALIALLIDVFDEQTEFSVHGERLEHALAGLTDAAGAGPHDLQVLATVRGLVLPSSQLSMSRDLTLAAPGDFTDLPDELAGVSDSVPHALALVTVREELAGGSLTHARTVLSELLRALRLYGDSRIALGGLAWMRAGVGPWRGLALGEDRPGRTASALVVRAEHQGELRSFAALVARHAPQDEVAWALERYELGCERADEHVALSDWLLALRALLEPEGPSSGLLCMRLAALCGEPSDRHELAERAARAIELERAVVRGAVAHGQDAALVRALGDHLRGLLRHVMCGHLPADLYRVADELLERGDYGAEEPYEDDSQLDTMPIRASAPGRARRARKPAEVEPTVVDQRPGRRAIGA
jgi:hypothetical protein